MRFVDLSLFWHFFCTPGPAPHRVQWIQRSGQRRGPRRSQEGAAGVRPVEQTRRILSGVQHHRGVDFGRGRPEGRLRSEGTPSGTRSRIDVCQPELKIVRL